MKTLAVLLVSTAALVVACAPSEKPSSGKGQPMTLKEYFTPQTGGIQTGGVKRIPIRTPAGEYNVWTKRFGNNSKIKVLLLHGGPGSTHEYFESVESFFPQEGIEFIYYDQLGSGNSDHPEGKGEVLWDLPRFVDELEQVRRALGLNNQNFYLLGNSWGGILAMEYALKYQHNLKALIISNMMASAPEYDKYADEVLAKQMDPAVLREIRDLEARNEFENPRYMELLMPNFYTKHLLRMPLEEWPDAVNRAFAHMNMEVYVTMQGPSEFGIAGKLDNWDISKRLPEIEVPTLVVGATHDTMDPNYMEWMSTQVKDGQFLLCPNGSHLAMWDDQKVWMEGIIAFIKAINNRGIPM